MYGTIDRGATRLVEGGPDLWCEMRCWAKAIYFKSHIDVDNPWLPSTWHGVWICPPRLQGMCYLWPRYNLSTLYWIGEGCVWRISLANYHPYRRNWNLVHLNGKEEHRNKPRPTITLKTIRFAIEYEAWLANGNVKKVGWLLDLDE